MINSVGFNGHDLFSIGICCCLKVCMETLINCKLWFCQNVSPTKYRPGTGAFRQIRVLFKRALVSVIKFTKWTVILITNRLMFSSLCHCIYFLRRLLWQTSLFRGHLINGILHFVVRHPVTESSSHNCKLTNTWPSSDPG